MHGTYRTPTGHRGRTHASVRMCAVQCSAVQGGGGAPEDGTLLPPCPGSWALGTLLVAVRKAESLQFLNRSPLAWFRGALLLTPNYYRPAGRAPGEGGRRTRMSWKGSYESMQS
jgi:hypothetical protein